jgi:WD40 repeat protein
MVDNTHPNGIRNNPKPRYFQEGTVMKIRSWLLASSFAAIVVVGCNSSTEQPKPSSPGTSSTVDNPNVDVGKSLFTPGAAPKPLIAPARGTEPLVIPGATVQYENKQTISSEVDAKIDLLATRAPAGHDLKDPNIVYHPRDTSVPKVPYLKLNEGDNVQIGQVISVLDDQLVSAKMVAAEKTIAASLKVQIEAGKGVMYSEKKRKIMEDLLKTGNGSLSDFLNDQVTLSRFMENLAQSEQTIAKAESDLKESQVMLAKHQIRSSVNGIVRSVVKRPGEFVKAGDKIMEIQATDRIRVEGNMDVQYFSQVKKGMMVTVEPALPRAPASSHAWHRQEVTGIAVTGHLGQPLVVSVSADGSALVWDPVKNAAGHILLHAVPVKSVACSPPGSKTQYAVTGAEDGKVRFWDLTNPDKLPTTPSKEPGESHSSAVQAIAFSPDGKFVASAAGREVFIWEVESGKKLYALPPDHRDAITTLSFTPQATLVTAAKDRTIKIWKLGADKAAVIRTIEYRAGVVDVLGVSRDGGRVLFDQEKGRIDLVNLADKQTTGQIQNLGTAATFATLALFGQDDSLIVTAGGEGEMKGGLQMWEVPPVGGRGSEIARLITPGRVGVACAAFSPVKDSPFLVVGTSAGSVHLWKLPTEADRAKCSARVANVDSTDPRYVTVRVEMDNPGLLDRSTATIIIPPMK